MQPYNVEIFNRSFALIQHYNVGSIDYSYDYLNPAENSVIIPFNALIKKGDYIWIKNDQESYFGYITGIAVNEAMQGFSELKFKPFITIFDAPILFDTTLQGSSISLEGAIAQYISAYWINNTDTEQNVFGLQTQILSNTTGWGFHITASQKDTNKAIINFMTSIIKRALTKYQVGLYVTPDFGNKTITVQIGVKTLQSFTVEADLPNVIEKSIIVNEDTADINKLIIYDQADLVTNVIYYKHPDGSYDTYNTNRMSPVIYGMTSVAGSEDTPFSEAAEDAANKQFDRDSYNNLIELTVQNDDTLVMPKTLTIGQIVNVTSNGTSYGSIFTGVERSEVTKLIFGTIRMDLTKILKEAIKNG